MRVLLWPVVFKLYFIIIMVLASGMQPMAKALSTNSDDIMENTSKIQAPVRHTSSGGQSTNTFTYNGSAGVNTKYESVSFSTHEKMCVEQVTIQTEHPCNKEHKKSHTMEECTNSRQQTFQCKNAASFYNWQSQVEVQWAAVWVVEVNGGLTLPSNTTLSLRALFLQQANITHFTKHTQDTSTLEELNLCDNPSFDVSSLQQLGTLPSLVTLRLAGIPLTSQNLNQVVTNMPALHYLDISFTNLHYLPPYTFHQNAKLRTLHVGGNEFISLTLDQGLLQQLEHLNISSCSIEKLEVESRTVRAVQTRLQMVDLSHNRLISLPTSFMNMMLDSLPDMYITDNLWNKSCTLCSLYHLWKYAVNHPHVVHGRDSLACFDQGEALKTCGWKECPATCSCDATSKTVNCNAAGLKTIPLLGPSDAEVLLLENNTLVDMSGIESPVWCRLKRISADHNRISSMIPPGTLGSCTCFDWKEKSCLPQTLQKLSLNHNQIKNLSLSDYQLLYALQELHMSANKVEHMAVHMCGLQEHDEAVSCNSNSYDTVTPLYLRLRELDLSSNKLVTFPTCIIQLMPHLTRLNVSHNRLRQFCVDPSMPAFKLLEKLDLDGNNLRMIKPLLTLAHNSNLKNFSFLNNPWNCSSEINKELSICQEADHQKGILEAMVGILIIICMVLLVVHLTCRKFSPNIFYVLGSLPPAKTDATFGRKNSVVIVHSYEDDEIVKKDLVDPLEKLGYSVAWNENSLDLGEDLDASIDNAVANSRRMLVVVSKYLITYPNGQQIIQRGLREESNVPGFQVMALVMGDPPNEMPGFLHEVVVKRNYLPRRDSNYIRKICNFLPALVDSERFIAITETDIWGFLQHQMEIMKKIDNQRENHRTHLQKVFPIHHLNSYGGSVSTAITLQDENRVVNSYDQNIWNEVLSRSHEIPMTVSTIEQPHNFSYHYTLKENNEEIAQMNDFDRKNRERQSTRF